MTARLPVPGQDDGTWGSILNEFLEVSLNSDGTLATSAVTSALPSPIPTTNLGTGTASSSNFLRGDGTWAAPSGASNATSSSPGLVQLDGDLGGTATSPTVTGIQGNEIVTGTPSNGQVLTYESGSGKWTAETPASAPVSSVFGRIGAVTAQSGDYAASQVTGALVNSNNLSDVSNEATALSNLGGASLTGASFTGAVSVMESGTSGNLFSVTNTHATPSAPSASFVAAAADDSTLGIEVSGDADYRFTVDSNGKQQWSSGSVAADTDLYRAGSAQLKTDGQFTVGTTLNAQDISVTGITGATAASRYVGATASGAPTSGTFKVGDFIIDQSPAIWVCTSAGSPGSWNAFNPTSTSVAPAATGTVSSVGSANSVSRRDHVHAQDFGGLFGDGSDGTVTYDGTTTILGMAPSSSTYTLTRDIFCTSITINNGVTVNTGPWRIFCAGTFTNNGTIASNGTAASGITQGASSSGSVMLNAGGTPGTGNGGTGGQNGSRAYTGIAGAGGAGSQGTGGSAGGINSGLSQWWRTPYPLLSGVLGIFANSTPVGGAPGGGSGGGDGTNKGGGGGGGGGLVGIIAWAVINNGTISAIGGNGGTPPTGNCGGGGGGGGGLILVYTLSAWTAGTTSVSGGSAGSGVGTGSAGSNGGNGHVLNVVIA